MSPDPDARTASPGLPPEYAALLHLIDALAAHRSVDALVEELPQALSRCIPCDALVLTLKDPADPQLMTVALTEPKSFPRLPRSTFTIDEGPAGRVWQSQRSRVIRPGVDPDTGPGIEFAREVGVRVVCFLPMTTARARYGVLVIGSRDVDHYEPAAVLFMEHVATQVAIAIERATTIEELARTTRALSRERDRMQLLLRVADAVGSIFELPALVQALSRLLRESVWHHFASVSLWDAEAGGLRRHALVADHAVQLREGQLVRVASPSAIAFATGRTVVVRRGDSPRLVDDEAARIMEREGLHAACCVILQTARGKYGTLSVASPDESAFGADEVELLEQVAQHVAVAIEDAMHVNEIERYRRELAASLDGLRQRVKELTAVHQTARHLQRDDQTVEEVLAFVATILPGAFQHPEITGARVSYGDVARASQHHAPSPWALTAGFATSDQTRGSIEVVYREARPFLKEERELLESLADMLESALDRRLAEEALRHSGRRLKLLLDVNNLLVSELDYEALVRRISDALREVVRHQYAGVALLDPERQQIRIEGWITADGPALAQRSSSVPFDRSPAGVAFQRDSPTVFREREIAAFGESGSPTLLAAGMTSLCCVPLVGRHGKVGVLGVASADPAAFSPAEIEVLGHVSGQIAIAVENALVYRAVAGSRDKLAEEKHYLEEEFRLEQNFSEIIGKSDVIRETLRTVETVAPTDATVLLLGETGTGKELLARALHDLSPRRARSFVRLHGAALPANLIESELFGYVKGAFTGAASDRMGRLELAHEGTLFLDEVGDLPLDLQIKLLRVLQEREFERLGSNRTERVDIRLIAATNRHLPTLVSDGTFRSDFYYRLNVFPIHVPALRDRREDVPALVEHFVRQFARRMKRPITRVPEAAMAALAAWHWPGNIRELENVIERAVILSSGSTLQLPAGLFDAPPPPPTAPALPALPALAGVERDAILGALRVSKGVVAGPNGAAARLGLKRTTLQAKMRRLGIARPSF